MAEQRISKYLSIFLKKPLKVGSILLMIMKHSIKMKESWTILFRSHKNTLKVITLPREIK